MICACRYLQRWMPFPGQRRFKRRGGLALAVTPYPKRIHRRSCQARD